MVITYFLKIFVWGPSQKSIFVEEAEFESEGGEKMSFKLNNQYADIFLPEIIGYRTSQDVFWISPIQGIQEGKSNFRRFWNNTLKTKQKKSEIL